MRPLIADEFFQDPRLAAAKKQVLAALEEHTGKLTQVRPADPERKQSYEEACAELSASRGVNIWYPYIGTGIGNSALVELSDGSVKYDFITGIGPHFFGHSHRDVVSACFDAALSDTVMQGNLMQNRDQAQLAKLLTEVSGMDHCFLTSSGVMAVENGLKIAFQKNTPASRVLAFDDCFAGRTLAASWITDKPVARLGLPQTLSVDYVPFYDPADPEGSTEYALRVLRRHIARYPGRHATMIMELVQGEGGFKVGTTAFFEALIDVLKENNITVIADEIQTFGRTTEMFAFQYFGLEDKVDIVTIGKLSQVCATLFTKECAPKPGLLTQTFSASTSAIRTGLMTINALKDDGFLGPNGRIAQLHNHFVQNLQNLGERRPGMVSGPFGVGALIAFTPFDGEAKRTMRLSHELFEAGVITFIAGSDPMRLRFLIPAGSLSFEEIDNAISIIEEVLVKEEAGVA